MHLVQPADVFAAVLPEIVILPTLGATDSPRRRRPTAVAVVHHGVCAAATGAASALLERRGET